MPRNGIVRDFASMSMSNFFGYMFELYRPLVHVPIDFTFTLTDLFLLIILPMGVYLALILLAIRLELKQNLATIYHMND